jgi:hypothetical protein
MYESIKEASSLLFREAKKKKNGFALKLRRHSGSILTYLDTFDSKSYRQFCLILSKIFNGTIELPGSLPYKLNPSNKNPLNKILNILIEHNIDLKPFFDNYFNEEIHKEKFSQALLETQKLIKDSPNCYFSQLKLLRSFSTTQRQEQ